jgi:uncharacterized protein YjiS (DUF1127 family)
MYTRTKADRDDPALTPETWRQIKQSALARAREERARSLRAAVLALLRATAAGLRRVTSLGRRAGVMARDRWNRYQAWRARRQAVRELSGLDDRSLKDMGLHRSEIERVIQGEGATRSEGRLAAVLLHKPYARARSRPAPEHTKRAAA